MKTPVIILVFCFVANIILAQNPFEKYGYHTEPLTLSKGKYNEFFDNDTIVRIGNVVLSVNSNKIIGFVTTDTVYSEATLEPEIISRWLSPDPLAAERPGWSPYNFVRCNPIVNIDPNGALDTKYTDANGNEIANTNDGNNSTVVVADDKRQQFDMMLETGKKHDVLDSKNYNAYMISEVTPENKGVYFTSASFGLNYMAYNSKRLGVEHSGYVLGGGKGLFVDARKGMDVRVNEPETNSVGTSGTYTPVNAGLIKIGGSSFQVSAHIHTHPKGEFWSGAMASPSTGAVSGTYPPGDFQAFQGNYFKNKAAINNFYLIQGTSTLRVMSFDYNNGTFTEKSLGNLNQYTSGQKQIK